MPAYTYQCLDCSRTLDVVHGVAERPKPPCPDCGGLTQRIVTRAPAIIGMDASDIDASGEVQKPSACGHNHPPGFACAWNHDFEAEINSAKPELDSGS